MMFFFGLLRQTHFHCKLEGKKVYMMREIERKKNDVNTQYYKRKEVQR
jgi:hypothetical protein